MRHQHHRVPMPPPAPPPSANERAPQGSPDGSGRTPDSDRAVRLPAPPESPCPDPLPMPRSRPMLSLRSRALARPPLNVCCSFLPPSGLVVVATVRPEGTRSHREQTPISAVRSLTFVLRGLLLR